MTFGNMLSKIVVTICYIRNAKKYSVLRHINDLQNQLTFKSTYFIFIYVTEVPANSRVRFITLPHT